MDPAPVLIDHAVAVDRNASRILQTSFRRWRYVDLGLARHRRVGAPFEANQRLVVVTDARAPDAAVGRTDPDRIASKFDAVILLRVDRLIRLGPAGGDLAVSVCIDDAGAPSLRCTRVVRLVERNGVEPTDCVVLPEDQVVVFVEHVMVRGKAAVDHRELFRLRIKQFDLPRARAFHREVLRKRVRRVLAVCGLILRRADPRGHPDMSFRGHRDAAWIGLPLPDLLAPPVRRCRRIRIEHGRVRGKLDLARCVRARIEHRQDVGALVRPIHQPVRVVCWIALVGGGRIAAAAGRQPPVPHRDHEIAFDADGTRRRFWIGAGGDSIGPIGERLALLTETFEDIAHVPAVGTHRRVSVPGLEHRGQ